MGFSPTELDMEVRGLDLEQVKSILNEKYRYNEVGKAFGVLRLRDKPVEIAPGRKSNPVRDIRGSVLN